MIDSYECHMKVYVWKHCAIRCRPSSRQRLWACVWRPCRHCLLIHGREWDWDLMLYSPLNSSMSYTGNSSSNNCNRHPVTRSPVLHRYTNRSSSSNCNRHLLLRLTTDQLRVIAISIMSGPWLWTDRYWWVDTYLPPVEAKFSLDTSS